MLSLLVTFAPPLLLAALLLAGRFVGEEQILRRFRPRRRPRRTSRAPTPMPAPCLVRLRLETALMSGRGPPPAAVQTIERKRRTMHRKHRIAAVLAAPSFALALPASGYAHAGIAF